MSYQINQRYISRNRSGQILNPIGIVVDDTATPGATDENEQTYFNSIDVQASAHAFIGWHSITETIPDGEVAWGSGPNSNRKFLQVELCLPASHDPGKFQEVWNRAVWYFAYKFINKINIKTVTKDNLMRQAVQNEIYKIGSSASNTNTSNGLIKDLQHNLNRLLIQGLQRDR